VGCTDDGVEDVISQERNSIYLQLNCKVEYHEDSESDTKLPIMENHCNGKYLNQKHITSVK
jgi:hypothetical protein